MQGKKTRHMKGGSKMMNWIENFLTNQGTIYRVCRVIVAGLIGVAISFIPQIVSQFTMDPLWQGIIIAVVMAVLKPINDELVKYIDDKDIPVIKGQENQPKLPEADDED